MSEPLCKPATAGVVSLPARLIRGGVIACFALLCGAPAHADPVTDGREVSTVIQDYLQGSSYNQHERLRRAFHPDARLYLSQGTDGMREVGIAEYAGRLITGMNWESTRGVVAAIIQRLEAESGAARSGPDTDG